MNTNAQSNGVKILALAGLGALLLLVALSLPPFGFYPWRESGISTAQYYLEQGVYDSGAMNMVGAITWEHRGYDTVGEATVLFTAVAGTLLLAGWRDER